MDIASIVPINIGPGGWGGDWYVWHAPEGLRARAATGLGCMQAGAEKLGVIEASYASAIIGVLAPCRLIVKHTGLLPLPASPSRPSVRRQKELPPSRHGDGPYCYLKGKSGVSSPFLPEKTICRVGKGRPAGSIELRVSPSPSKIPYGGFSPVRLQMDRQW